MYYIFRKRRLKKENATNELSKRTSDIKEDFKPTKLSTELESKPHSLAKPEDVSKANDSISQSRECSSPKISTTIASDKVQDESKFLSLKRSLGKVTSWNLGKFL